MKTAMALGRDGLPTSPAPLPAELEAEFTEAHWRSQRWRETPWMGRKVPRSPSDLVACAQLIMKAKPDWIVHAGSDDATSSFLASVCDLVNGGEVISLGGKPDEAALHPRVRRLEGDPADPTVATAVRELVGRPANAMLVLGLSKAERLVA